MTDQISQSARADETHHSFDYQFYLTVQCHFLSVNSGSLSRGGDVAVCAYGINQPSLPTPFYSVFVSISVLMALSAVFHSINSPDNSSHFHSVLPVLFLPNTFCHTLRQWTGHSVSCRHANS